MLLGQRRTHLYDLLSKYDLPPRTATLGALFLLATACSKTEDATPAVDTSNDNLALGNPSGAVASPASPTNYLLTKPQYTVGYNRDQGKPDLLLSASRLNEPV